MLSVQAATRHLESFAAEGEDALNAASPAHGGPLSGARRALRWLTTPLRRLVGKGEEEGGEEDTRNGTSKLATPSTKVQFVSLKVAPCPLSRPL